MARIPDYCLDSVLFIYPSEADAASRSATGGTGFLVTVPSRIRSDCWYEYVVSNSHVIRPVANPVISVSTTDGSVETITTRGEDWIHHPDGDDLAILFDENLSANHRYRAVNYDLICSDEMANQFEIGPGDDVFMVGRFESRDGKLTNRPSVRFGRISMMHSPSSADDVYQQGRGVAQQSVIVEMLSLPGFSGSPVFVELNEPLGGPNYLRIRAPLRLLLLGINWGHLTATAPVVNSEGKRHEEGWRVAAHSGATCIVPAWKLRQLLDTGPALEARNRMDGLLKIASEELGPGATTQQVLDRSVVIDYERRTDPRSFR